MSEQPRASRLPVKEGHFLGWILQVAAANGWRAWHVPFPVRPVGGGRFVPESRATGLPDLILLHGDPPRLVFAEVKGTGGTLRPAQREFLQAAQKVSDVGLDLDTLRGGSVGTRVVGAYVWEPGMEDAITDILRSRVVT